MPEQPAATGRVRASFAGWPALPMFPILAERFDLWLAQVKAEAWDEGYRDGSQDMSDLRAGRLTFQTITSNPYRQEATR